MTSQKPESEAPTIDNVPNEIWSAILESSLSLPDHDWRWRAGHLYKQKLSVIVAMSQVSSRWRQIALANTSLWTYVSLRAGESSNYPDENLLNVWIEQSASQPLWVNLVIGKVDLPSQPKIRDSLVRLLNTMSRWRVGCFTVEGGWESRYLWNELDPFINTSALLLDSLQIVTTISALPSKLWTILPSLTKLVITSSDLPWGWPAVGPQGHFFGTTRSATWLTQIHIPYNQLTHFCLTTSGRAKIVSWEQLHTVLSGSPNLVSCFLGGIFGIRDTDGFAVLERPIVLQHLKHLCLEASGRRPDSLPGHTNCVVIAPSLKTFTISNTKEWDHSSYTTFINQSSCQLEEFHLVYVNISSQDFLECMQLSPTLKVIHLHSTNSMANPKVCRAMTEWSDVSDCLELVPRLQVLSFETNPLCQYATDGYINMANMLKERCCPQKGSNTSFTTLAMPFSKQRLTKVALQELCGNPWNLNVVSNDDMYTISTLWKIYSNGI